MLWQKAWRETRMRFILSAIALGSMCVAIVLFEKENRGAGEGIPFVGYVWVFTYSTYAKDLFLVATLLLGFGGLLHERTTGTAGFTLALPVLRSELVAVRAAVGLLQMAGLAVLPALFVPTLSRLVHESYPARQAWEFSLLWIGCGTMVFAIGFLVSSFAHGEYVGAVACVAALIAYFALVNLPSAAGFPFLSLDKVMSGDDMPYFHEGTHQLIGPLPWTALLVIMLIALALLAIASRVLQQKDF